MAKLQIDRVAELLSRTPVTVRSLVGGLPAEWTVSSDDEGNWAPFDVVGHLIHGEETDWIPRAEIILDQGDNRTFVPFDRVAQFASSSGKTLQDLLIEFERLRAENLAKLSSWNISDEDLDLKGMHPELGEVTLSQLIATWAVHDLNHIQQLTKFLAGKYAAEVGPWTAYLSVLQ